MFGRMLNRTSKHSASVNDWGGIVVIRRLTGKMLTFGSMTVYPSHEQVHVKTKENIQMSTTEFTYSPSIVLR